MNTKVILEYKSNFTLISLLHVVTFKVFIRMLEDKEYIREFLKELIPNVIDIHKEIDTLEYSDFLLKYKDIILRNIKAFPTYFFDSDNIKEKFLSNEAIQKEIKDSDRILFANNIGGLNNTIERTTSNLMYYYKTSFCNLISVDRE